MRKRRIWHIILVSLIISTLLPFFLFGYATRRNDECSHDDDTCRLGSNIRHVIDQRPEKLSDNLEELGEKRRRLLLLHQVLFYKDVVPSTLCGAESFLLHSIASARNATGVGRIKERTYANGQTKAGGGLSTLPSPDEVILILWVSNRERFLSTHSNWIRTMFDAVMKLPNGGVSFLITELSVDDVLDGTPLSSLFRQRQKTSSGNILPSLGQFTKQNIANAVRLAIVYKYGGTYSDTDNLWVQDPSSLLLQKKRGEKISTRSVVSGAVALESEDMANNAIFQFPKGSAVVYAIMEEFVRHYDGNWWGHQGPILFTRVLLSDDFGCYRKSQNIVYCRTESDTNDGGSTSTVRLWDVSKVSPYPWQSGEDMVNLGVKSFELFNGPLSEDAFVVHLWHKVTGDAEKVMCQLNMPFYRMSYIGSLRKEMCPSTFRRIVNSSTKGGSRGGRYYCAF